MSLQLQTLAKRSLTALFFVIALLGSLLFSYTGFSIFFFLVAIIGLNEFTHITRKFGVSGNKPLLFSIATLHYLSSVNWMYLTGLQIFPVTIGPVFLTVVCVFLFLVMAIFSSEADPLKGALYQSMALFYAVLPMCLLHELVFISTSNADFEPGFLFGIILLIWSNDTFAYLGGSLFGKRKLLERISPGKTIEGSLIGILITFFLSCFLESMLKIKAPMNWALLGVIVPVTATLGDLLESFLKRQAGVKDSGNLLPGHGGVLDRFDSLILVTPLVVLLLKLL